MLKKMRSKKKKLSIKSLVLDLFRWYTKIVTETRRKKLNGFWRQLIMKLAKCSKKESSFKWWNLRTSKKFMQLRIGVKLPTKISSRLLISRDLNSRKTKKIKWRQLSSYLSSKKDTSWWKWEDKTKTVSFSKRKKISSPFWTVLKAAQEPKNV